MWRILRNTKLLNLGGGDLRKALLICLITLFLTMPIAANEDVNTLIIDGQSYKFVEPLLNQDGRILVPMRPIFEILGAEVNWEQETKTISSVYDDKEIIIIVDNDTPLINNIQYKIDVPAQIINSRTFVPLRFIGESLGYQVAWDQGVKQVIMTESKEGQEQMQLASFEPATEEEQTLKVISTAVGEASWYGKELHGQRTSSGEVFDCYAFTAAHPSLPFGTYLNVTFLNTDQSVIVRVNDRGPNQKIHPNRIVDLSQAAAEAIGLKAHGVGQVKVEVLAGLPE